MNIVKIQVKNFLSISDVEITPGQVNQIVGMNSQGKTSIIRAIEFAAQGSSDVSIIKHGETEAEVIIEIDDGTKIKRTLNEDGKQKLDVRKEEFKAASPQAILDNLFKSHAFNPIELLDPKKRVEAIMKTIQLPLTEAQMIEMLDLPPEVMPSIDYSQHGLKVIEQLYKYFYGRRAEANKAAAEKRARFETYQKDLPQGVTAPERTREQIRSEIQTLNENEGFLKAKINGIDDYVRTVKQKEDAYYEADKNVKKAEADLEKAKAALETGTKYLEAMRGAVHEALNEVESMRAKIPDATALTKERGDIQVRIEEKKALIKEHDNFEFVERMKAQLAQHEEDMLKAENFATSLSVTVDKLKGEVKEKLMSQVEMPVAGLSFNEGEFTLEGAKIENLSTSKSIRLAVSLARKLSGKAKIICVDGAEALDEETYAAFRDEVDADGFTYFLTRVGVPFAKPGDKVITMQKGSAVQ